MAEENVTETTTEPSGNNEAVIGIEKEEKEQESKQESEETTRDGTVQPSPVEGVQSKVAEEKQKVDEPDKEGDGTEKNEDEKPSPPMEPDVSDIKTEEEEERIEEQQQADLVEAGEDKEVWIVIA